MAGKFKFDWANTMQKIEEQDKKQDFKDERIYYPQFNDNGTASAIIRFLPSPDTDIPFVKLYNHGFEKNGWFIENCPTTINKKCPVCEENSKAWNSGDEDTARYRKRKLNYYSNIQIIKDPANPDNEGKVFLFRYGKKIYDKIMEQIKPEDGVSEPVMVFDYYDGANFKLIIKKIKVGSRWVPNYDSSSFEAPSSLGSDSKIEKIHEQRYNLSDLISEDKFKDYEALRSKFNRVVGVSGVSTISTTSTRDTRVTEETSSDETGNAFGDGEDEEFFASLQDD